MQVDWASEINTFTGLPAFVIAASILFGAAARKLPRPLMAGGFPPPRLTAFPSLHLASRCGVGEG
ncbi:hypothetical protein GQ53DRAFT_748487 [Thozetella sp. PMI_491]|nr:hypothetical protein GQ53DRAFT_748487 [Thozetella sp. PMI_491]